MGGTVKGLVEQIHKVCENKVYKAYVFIILSISSYFMENLKITCIIELVVSTSFTPTAFNYISCFYFDKNRS